MNQHFTLVNFYTLLRFIFVGLTSAVVYFTSFALVYDVFHINYKIAITISYCLSVIFHYSLNRIFTFKAYDKKLLPQILKYSILQVLNYLLTLSIVIATVKLLHLSPYIGMIFCIGATFITNFFIGKLWVYK